MVATIFTACLQGIEAHPVTVEVDLSAGIPNLAIVGLPDTGLNESKERIRAAIKNSGYSFPLKKIVINLAPAHLRKEGTSFDLPLCVGILLAGEMLAPTEFLDKACFIGEVSLEGKLRGVRGALSVALMAKEAGYQYVVVPEENRDEAALVDGIEVFGLSNLNELPIFLMNPYTYYQAPPEKPKQPKRHKSHIDFADIKGQTQAKRALEIAAAGRHNALLTGPPGSGKSMLSKAFSGILPTLSFDEMLDVSRIYSAAGLLEKNQCLIQTRPYRSPHHSASKAGLTGGGSSPKPGEITLSHRGVLFLDEFVEFPRDVLEVLRQPLEDGCITISRAQQSMTYPAKFQLIAAMNPCPCGYYGDSTSKCSCSGSAVQRYNSRLSGPLLDRLDLQLDVPRLSHKELLTRTDPKQTPEDTGIENSNTIRNRVEKAYALQQQRFKDDGIYTNSEMTPHHIKRYCALDDGCRELLSKAVSKLNLSARAFDRILRVSRTIADLDNKPHIESQHIAEALQYRGIEKRSMATGTASLPAHTATGSAPPIKPLPNLHRPNRLSSPSPRYAQAQ